MGPVDTEYQPENRIRIFSNLFVPVSEFLGTKWKL